MITEKQIMVVDDDEACLSGLSKTLEKWGYKVITAENGIEALKKLKQQPCDLVITDMKMPKMNGIDLIKEAQKANIKTKFIIVTAYGDMDTYLKAMNLGAFEYINKPVKTDELKLGVSGALGRTYE